MTTEIAEYSKTEAALAQLKQNYKDVVFDVSTREGMETARKGRAEVREYRFALERTRKTIKEAALRTCQVIDSEARRISTALSELEEPIDAQIKNEEKRLEDLRTAEARAALARIEAEKQARIEAEEARLAAERREIEAQRAALAQAERERAAVEAAARLKIEEEQRASRALIEEEQRAARAKREEENAAAAAVIAAEERRLREERIRLEEQRRVAEAAERKAREVDEAKALEARRHASEIEGGRETLAAFVERFGGQAEFREIAAAITDWLLLDRPF